MKKNIKYLSFDCATKTLGVCYFHYDCDKLNTVLNRGLVELIKNSTDISKCLDIKLWCIDLIEGKNVADTDIPERLKSLHEKLNKLMMNIPKPDYIVIEYQMNLNNLSNIISNAIMMYFAHNFEIKLVKPAAKNSIWFHESLAFHYFIEKYSRNYDANKAHSKANLIWFLNLFEKQDVIKDIKKLDDVADAFMQLFNNQV